MCILYNMLLQLHCTARMREWLYPLLARATWAFLHLLTTFSYNTQPEQHLLHGVVYSHVLYYNNSIILLSLWPLSVDSHFTLFADDMLLFIDQFPAKLTSPYSKKLCHICGWIDCILHQNVHVAKKTQSIHGLFIEEKCRLYRYKYTYNYIVPYY